jgi:hypothetical protein
VRLRPLSESEAYARCYGEGDENVRSVRLEPRRPRYEPRVSGEELRRAFETRLNKRDPLPDPPPHGVSNRREPAAA